MSLLPTPISMPFIASGGNILPITGLYRHRHRQHQQHQLTNQPYLLVNPDRSLYPNYYLVYVPLIGSPSTSTSNLVASTMSTSVLQTSTLLNSLLTATSLLNSTTPSSTTSNIFVRKPNTIPTNMSSSIAYIRQQYRYNMRPSYRYVPTISLINSWRMCVHCSYLSHRFPLISHYNYASYICAPVCFQFHCFCHVIYAYSKTVCSSDARIQNICIHLGKREKKMYILYKTLLSYEWVNRLFWWSKLSYNNDSETREQ